MDVDDSTVGTGDDNDNNIDVVQTASLNDGDMMACIETHCRTSNTGLQQSASASNPNVSGASDIGADLATCIYESCMSRDSAGSLRTPDHLADVDLNSVAGGSPTNAFDKGRQQLFLHTEVKF